MNEPVFLTREQVLYIQEFEANLMDLFEMAATYAISISHHHRFLDGNKRCAMGSALAFLAMNGYTVHEHKDEALADLLLDFLNKRIGKEVGCCPI